MEPIDGGVCLGMVARVLSLEDAASIPATTMQMSKDLDLLAEKAAMVERLMRLSVKKMGGGSTRRLALAQRGESDEDKDELAIFRGRVNEGHGGVVVSKQGGFLVSGNEMMIHRGRNGKGEGILRPVRSKMAMKKQMAGEDDDHDDDVIREVKDKGDGRGPQLQLRLRQTPWEVTPQDLATPQARKIPTQSDDGSREHGIGAHAARMPSSGSQRTAEVPSGSGSL